MAGAGAFCYGLTIICNRLLATRGFGPQATLSVRFAVSAGALLAVLAVARGPLVPARGERLRVLGMGGVLYALQSSLFYAALQRGTAAAVALLFYAYPACVTLAEAGRSRHLPGPRLLGALALSGAGTMLIVVAGADVAITSAGAAFALAAAVAFAVYLLIGAVAAPRTATLPGGALVTGAWVGVGAAASLTALGVASGGLRAPGAHWELMVANGVATAAAFSLIFAALERLGASRTAVVMTIEALSAVVLGALLLGESVGWVQLVGGLGILVATVLISTSKGPGSPRASRTGEPVLDIDAAGAAP